MSSGKIYREGQYEIMGRVMITVTFTYTVGDW